jgi:hypothetical protein
VWHVWSKKTDIYVAHGNMGGIQKFSFHAPDVCRLAFTKENGTPPKLADRATHKWRRDPTPPAGGGRVVRALQVAFWTDVLSTALAKSEHQRRNLVWIEPAPLGGTTIVDLMFTHDDEEAVLKAIGESAPETKHRLIAYRQLDSGERFFLAGWHSRTSEETIRSTAPHEDLIVSPIDIANSGRPIRLTVLSNPKDGDFLQAWEWGAYAVAPPLTNDGWEALREAMLVTPTDFRRIASVMASPRASFADPGSLLRQGAIAFHLAPKPN